MADYFDRLLARYTPAAAADGTGGPGTRVRVRPRLSGPFERAEALRHGPPEPDEPAALIPSAPRADEGRLHLVRPGLEVRTERHTVVRTEQAPQPGQGQPSLPAEAFPAPLLRPPVTPSPKSRPGGEEAGRAARRARSTAPDAPAPAPAAPGGPAQPAPAPLRVAALPAPRGSDSAAARGAVPGPVGRRAPRQAERVVHVQIGRLEVSAAPPPGANASPAGRPVQRTGRPAPVLTLDDYLSRGGKRD
ncbi:hypothetical protein C5F59_008690 [Streptomyces sp. QL37]|uniref:hypothetical protein n=1 Tax=Streptomyces sp. QL37 TaxID=2093747 RepID=UPI000CF29298|nr:hypothetical protein [Streptomyces sp. QL37]PPQ56752.1 hypothetical protein C5F59_08785 [Streptomyces sp. QL37]